MRYAVKCTQCGAVIWIRGTEHELMDNDPDWDDACDHVKNGGDYEITDSEPIDDD